MKYRRTVVAFAIAAASASIAYALANVRQFDAVFGEVERKTLDYRLNNSEGSAEKVAVSMIMFDTASMRDMPYLVPFPRVVLADLINAAAANGAKAIGLDVYLDRLYPELSEKDSGDVKLRDAIAHAVKVLLF
jgi:CHASE2 domain-containing sensor protein